MSSLFKYLALVWLVGLIGLAEAQPRCPTIADIEIWPTGAPPFERIALAMAAYPGTTGASWEVTQQDPSGRINVTLIVGWEGGFGIPSYSTSIDPPPPGYYEFAIQPGFYISGNNEMVPCPALLVPLTIAGNPSAAVPAPLFSLPGLLLLMGLFGLLGWAALRPR